MHDDPNSLRVALGAGCGDVQTAAKAGERSIGGVFDKTEVALPTEKIPALYSERGLVMPVLLSRLLDFILGIPRKP